jgi:hemerythrin
MTSEACCRARPLISRRDALGHHEIDADHVAISDAWVAAMRCKAVALPFHVARLAKVMRDHFEREIRLVEAAGVQCCWCHQNEHAGMLAVCHAAFALSEHAPRKARQLLRKELAQRIRRHVATTDQIAVLIINTAAPA